MSFITDTLFGSDAEQVGTAQSPGDAWLQNMLQPMIQRGIGIGMSGQGLYQTPNVPSTPQAQSYQGQGYNPSSYMGQGYNAPQAPWSSPSDYLGQYQDTSMNAMEQFWGGGGGGSAMGGWSGSGVGAGAEIATLAGRNAMQDYQNAILPYAQMQNQAGQFNAGVQNTANQYNAGMRNQASMFGAGAQNTAGQFNAGQYNQMAGMGYGGALQGMQNQQQSYAAPWNLAGMYSGATGSPMVQPGQQGIAQSFADMSPLLLGGAMGWS